MPVSEDVRRDNAKWVKRRTVWRERYGAISREIYDLKEVIKNRDSVGLVQDAKEFRIILAAMQDKARDMMIERLIISGMLHSTAYKWEDIT